MRLSFVIWRAAFCIIAFFAAEMVNGAPYSARADYPSFETLAEQLLPTVVNVSTTTKVKNEISARPTPDLPQFPPGSPFEDFFKEFYDRYKNTAPMDGDKNVSALGSGFVIDAAKGYIVTNNHVIKDADEIKVILHDDTSIDAKLVGADEKTDIALLQIKPPLKPLTATTWGNSDEARVGSWALAIGNPFGLGGTVTAGIISARQRNINAGPYDDFIQTDASINRGNSGGPMFNTKGEVIGVNTAIFSPSGGSVGIGFAVPSNLVKNVVDQLIKYGKTKRGWLGVKIQEVTPEIAEGLGLPSSNGALVSSASPKGPGEKAGIIAGDVITEFNGQKIDAMRKLPRLVAESEVGAKVPVKIWRKKTEQTVTVELGQLEEAEESGLIDPLVTAQKDGKVQSGAEISELGLSLAPINEGLRQTYGLDKSSVGLVITDVKAEGSAASVGLSSGDVLLQVDQADVLSVKDIKTKIEAAQKAGRASVLLSIERKTDRRFIAVKIKK